MKIWPTIAVGALLHIPFTMTAFAKDREPTADERAKIEAVLKADGFTSWGRIEFDDERVWEVDDAMHSDGHEYDLELDRTNFAITDRDRD